MANGINNQNCWLIWCYFIILRVEAPKNPMQTRFKKTNSATDEFFMWVGYNGMCCFYSNLPLAMHKPNSESYCLNVFQTFAMWVFEFLLGKYFKLDIGDAISEFGVYCLPIMACVKI